jgi:hypothetical protein
MKKKIFATLFISAAFILIIFIYTNPPEKNKYYPPCIAKKITGFDCAGCGSARACYQLLHGNIRQAADFNIMLLLMLPVIIIGLVHLAAGKLNGIWQKINRPLIFLLLILLFWIIRNIPLFPFSWLHSDR